MNNNKNKFLIIFSILFFVILAIDVYKYLYACEYNRNLERELILSGEIQGELSDISAKNSSVYYLLDYFYTFGISMIFQFVMPALIIISSCFSFHSKLHSGFIKNQILSIGYKKTIMSEIKKSYKSILLIVIFFAINLLMVVFASKFNFAWEMSNTFDYYGGIVSNDVVNFCLSYISYILVLLIVHLAYINFGLALCRKTKNFYLTVFVFVILFMFYIVSAEVIIGPILNKLFSTYYFTNGTNLFAFWVYDMDVTLLLQTIYAVLILVVSFLALFFTYRKKEGVIIDAEK